MIAEPIPEEPPPPEPVPVPTEQVAEVQDVPIPPQKPEPPKKKEVKKKDEKKPVNDEQFLNSLVDKLAKEQTAALPPTEEAPADEPQTEGIPQRLPAGEEDALRNYIKGCWFSAGGGASATELVVTLEIKLNPDATLRNVEISRKDRGRMGDPVFRSFAESAKRAVDKCGADRQPFPLNLQRDYAVWGYILARFRTHGFQLEGTSLTAISHQADCDFDLRAARGERSKLGLNSGFNLGEEIQPNESSNLIR